MWIVTLGEHVERTVFVAAHRKRTIVEPADVVVHLTKQEATNLYRQMAMAEYGSEIVWEGLRFKVDEKPPTRESLLSEL